MTTHTPFEQITRIGYVLAVLAIAACLAAAKAMIWPNWPKTKTVDKALFINGLLKAGLQADEIKSLPSSRSSDLATSEVLGFAIDEGYELRVMQGTAKERFNFQTAFLGRSPELKLTKRSVDLSSPSSSRGFINGRHARQTCLVEGFTFPMGYGVTRENLPILLDQKQTGSLTKILTILGISSNRSYECTLITVKSNGSTALFDEARWIKLLQALQRSINSSQKLK